MYHSAAMTVHGASMTTSELYDSDVLLDQARNAVKKKNYATAAKSYTQSVDKRLRANGNDIKAAEIMGELGGLYVELGKLTEAETILKEALAIGERATYAGHGMLAPICKHLSDLLVQQERWADAEPYATRNMEISEKTLSGEHRNTLQAIYNLGFVQKKLGKFPEAEKTFTKALKNIDSPLGPLEDFKYELAMLLAEQGKVPEAEKAYKEAIDGFEYRSNLPRLAECLTTYAEFLKKNDRGSEATALLERANNAKELSRDWHHSQDIFPSTLLRA